MSCINLLKKKEQDSKNNLYHIAIIMDGNRRWAKKQGKMQICGHKEGFKAVKKAVCFAIIKKIKILTLYAFSSENKNRPKSEIIELMELFLFTLKSQKNILKKYNIRLKVIGDIKYFSKDLQKYIRLIEILTQKNSGLILNIAANYSGKWDIIQSTKKIIQKFKMGLLREDQIEENIFSTFLSTDHLFPVDLLIRTGGEKRISNFLLWQIAYAEIYFTDIFWPDFNRYIFQDAITFFLSRNRRFGC
ncbi:polyprenyl diphosphate synthase [Buchnera aphidicola]|uniref:polyprenyl diphosphate synthase n=1 Tax=Buchnera aphidicola TaxID=9 RepID=UPI003BEF4149